MKSKLIKVQATSATQRHMMDSHFPSWGKWKITPADREVCSVAGESEVQGSCQKKIQFAFKCHLQSVSITATTYDIKG